MLLAGQSPCDRVEIAKITVTQRILKWKAGLHLDIAYHFAAYGNPTSAIMIDPEFGELKKVDASVGVVARQVKREGRAAIEISRGHGVSLDGAVLHLHVQWTDRAIARLKGSLVCVLPTHLPLLVTGYGPYYASELSPEPRAIAPQPRIELSPAWAFPVGRVTDRLGELLMVAVPARRLGDTIWYADESVVLGGTGFDMVSVEHRMAFRDRVLEVHRFLDAEFGQGQHMMNQEYSQCWTVEDTRFTSLSTLPDSFAPGGARMAGTFSQSTMIFMEPSPAGALTARSGSRCPCSAIRAWRRVVRWCRLVLREHASPS